MEDRKNVSLSMINKHRLLNKGQLQSDSQQRGIFYKAYAHGHRLGGECSLSVVWRYEKGKSRIDRYNLVFGLVGIDDYQVEELSFFPGKKLEKYIFPNSVEISLFEAAALLQDAYETSIMSKAFPLLTCSTKDVDRSLLYKKLSDPALDEISFVNAYAAAMRREDVLLMYDLSSSERQRRMGKRKAVLLRNKILSETAVCLKTNCADQLLRDTYILESYYSTSEDEIQRVLLSVKVLKRNGQFLIDSINELEKTVINEKNTQNPLNYDVLCSFYQVSETKALQKWLQTHQHLFLSGEFAYGTTYKWIIDINNPFVSYNINDCIFGEVIITDTQVAIFSQKPGNLIKLEKEILPILKRQITGMRKLNLSIASLYRIITGLS